MKGGFINEIFLSIIFFFTSSYFSLDKDDDIFKSLSEIENLHFYHLLKMVVKTVYIYMSQNQELMHMYLIVRVKVLYIFFLHV